MDECPSCHGTGRVHKESSLFPSCSGSDCLWCSDCDDKFHKVSQTAFKGEKRINPTELGSTQRAGSASRILGQAASDDALRHTLALNSVLTRGSNEKLNNKVALTPSSRPSQLAERDTTATPKVTYVPELPNPTAILQSLGEPLSAYSRPTIGAEHSGIDIDSVLSGFGDGNFNLEDHFLSLDLPTGSTETTQQEDDGVVSVRQSRSSWAHLVKGQSSRIKLIKTRYENPEKSAASVAKSRRQEVKSILTLQDSALTKKTVQQFENDIMQIRAMTNRDGRADTKTPSPLGQQVGASQELTTERVFVPLETRAQSLEDNIGSGVASSNALPNRKSGEPELHTRNSTAVDNRSSGSPVVSGKLGSANNFGLSASSHNLPHFHLKRLTNNYPLSSSLSNLSPSSGSAVSSTMANPLRDSTSRLRSPLTAGSTQNDANPAQHMDESLAGYVSSLSQSLVGSSLGLSLTGKKDFKVWYNDFVHESNVKAEAQRASVRNAHFAGFGDKVEVSDIFGTKDDANDCDAMFSMMRAALEFQKLKNDPLFTQQPPSSATEKGSANEQEGASPLSSDSKLCLGNRKLDIFKDERIADVEYQMVDEDSREEIPASGALQQLLDSLIFPTAQSDVYSEILLATYRFFTSAAVLLDNLRSWFNVELPANATKAQKDFFLVIKRPIQSRVTRVLLLWIKNHWHNFHISKELLNDLQAFVKSMEETAYSDASKILAAIRESRLQWYSTQYLSLSGQTIKPNLLRKLAPGAKPNEPLVLSLSEEQFATQITLIEQFHLLQLRADTYLHLMTNPASKEGGGANVAVKVLLEYAQWHYMLASYVASVILQQENPKKQAKAIKNFLRVANVCYDMCKNFATLFTIVYALKRPAVAQLSQAWELVPTKYLLVFSRQEVICSPTNGYESYWVDLRTKSLPLLPFFAAHIHDILLLNKQVPDFVEGETATKDPSEASKDGDDGGKLINFAKYTDLDSLICELELYRTCTFKDTINESTEFMATVFAHIETWPTVDSEILQL